MLYIGIDLGTSSVKLLLMDAAGNVKNIVSREYPLYFPNPGWSEQKPEDWYKETMQGLKELLEGFPKEEVAGISFGGQMHDRIAGVSYLNFKNSIWYMIKMFFSIFVFQWVRVREREDV